MSLLVFTRFLASRNLCRPLYYTPQTQRVEDFNRHTIAGQQASRDRLPTEAVLKGLADIYRKHAVEPRDTLRAAALAVLVVTGFRIGELLTLPLDCEVHETSGGQTRYGIRSRFLEELPPESVRWLTPRRARSSQALPSWNSPLTLLAWKLLPALVCGNTCVIKPAQDTPLSTFNLVRTLTDAGVPNGVINVVSGFGSSVGAPLTEHPDVRAISLTGSTAVGRTVGTTAAKSFKHCSLELGGKNPMIVLDDANLDLAVEGGLWGGFGTTGQRCTATSRIIVQKGVYREFVERYVSRAKALKIGNGLDESVDMGPAINEAQLKTDLSYVDIGRDEGAKLACGGHRLEKGNYQYGYFMEPTVFTDVDPKMRIAQEEIFGPVVSIIPCDGLEDAIAIANGIEYGLSSSLYTKDVNKAFTAMRDLYAGITYINAPTIGAEVHLPFGGTKATGNGHREGGIGAIDFYTEWKSVYIDYSDKLQKAQIDRVD